MTEPLPKHLRLRRCPHCLIATPLLASVANVENDSSENYSHRFWSVYSCSNCHGWVMASSDGFSGIANVFPAARTVPKSLPDDADHYLSEALDTLSNPSASIVMSASAIDAMLKELGLTEGSLNTRIAEAATNHLITEAMSAWAHDVRFDANDERHADKGVSRPGKEDAERCFEFAAAFAEVLFTIPARVDRGREAVERDREKRQKTGGDSR